jgi:hypothetical protein
MVGLQRAEEIAAEGGEWGAERVARWRLACENFTERYGVQIE